MNSPRDQATAYHEAGHAVVALALGRAVQRVSILPDRERLGQCEFKKGLFRPSEDWLEREILIALGGIAAEARHTGDADQYCIPRTDPSGTSNPRSNRYYPSQIQY